MKYTVILLTLGLGAAARPGFTPSFTPSRRADFTLQNGKDALAQKCVPMGRFSTVGTI